jgi:hypothetical protein
MSQYIFCSGFTMQKVTVTATFGACSAYREYNDGTCLYQTWSKNISFTFSGNHPALDIRFRYWQDYYNNNVLVWSGWITAIVPVPAGVLTYTYTQAFGYPHDCHEKRFCNFGTGGDPPIQKTIQ